MMAAQAVVDQSVQSIRIVYQPFLSSSRTKHLTSILSSSLPYSFLPVNDTSLSHAAQAQIVLLSRGGKPFAPIAQRPSVDFQPHRDLREKDWSKSSEKYQRFITRWNQAQTELPGLLATLRKYFSDRIIAKEAFHQPLQILAYTGEVQDVAALRQTIKSYRSLRRSQISLQSILEETHAMEKVAAHKYFGIPHLKAREYLIEDHRDRLDLFRLELEKRYMGMAMVRFPSVADPKPWILVPEDPVGSWGVDFPYRVEELIRLARIRFLLFEEEKEMVLREEARKVIEDDVDEILENFGEEEGDSVNAEGILKDVMGQLREERERLYRNDKTALVLPGNMGDFGPEFRKAVTMEDKAIYQISDQELVKQGAWRVED
jgi:hypothetical protein